jgi:hypothetical protein
MSFWLREVAGWLLVVLGLRMLYVCFELIQEQRIIEAGPLSIIGIIIFRGGIHLLKVAVAARICKLAHERERAQPTGRTAAVVVPGPRPGINSATRGS